MSTRALADDFISQRYGRRRAAQAATRHEAQSSGLERTSGAAESDSTTSTQSDVLGQALKFIPTEIVTAYTLLLNMVPGTTALTVLWALYGGFAALSGLAVCCQAKQKWNALGAADKAQMPWVFPLQGIVAATIAFLAWGAAVPGTIFTHIPEYQAWMGLSAVVVVTLLLNLLDGVFSSSPPVPQHETAS
jgi:hypothetical protein